jgi:GNAT superfamily N-acetyltransferase
MKKIADAQDKLGNPIEVWQSDTMQYTPVVAPFLKVWAELVDKGFSLPTFAFKISNRVVWVQDTSGNVQGGIAYEYYPDQRMGWLVLSFTEPEFRGRGLNQICHEYYEADCKKLGAYMLSSLVEVNNKSRLASAAKVGMYPKFYRLHKEI